MILYNLRRNANGYLIAKFDDDFNVDGVYEVTPTTCTCPAGPRPSCKHRKMLPIMLPRVDTEWFYCYETQQWQAPISSADQEPMIDKLDAFFATVGEIAEEPKQTLADIPMGEFSETEKAVMNLLHDEPATPAGPQSEPNEPELPQAITPQTIAPSPSSSTFRRRV